MHYDPSILEKHAARLHSRANLVVLTRTLLGLLLGPFLGLLAQRMVAPGVEAMAFIIPTVWCGLMGYAIGREKAFQLRLEAQRTMCQVAIEKNTRAVALIHMGPSEQRQAQAS